MLACLDGYMNIAMEQTEVGPILMCSAPCAPCAPLTARRCRCRLQEYVNGQLKNKYGDCFIRGNNVLYISTAKS